MAASRGPIPKRTDQRRRTNAPDVPMTGVAPIVETVEHPEPDGQWHPLAHRWYESLAESGQSRFYEPSDWALAQFHAESMTRLLNAEKFSASHLVAVMAGMTELLTSEGARRRVRMEVERTAADAPTAGVAVISDYRERLGAG